MNAEITGEIAHIDGGQMINHANDGRGVLGGVAVLPGGRGASGPVSVDVAPSA